ncbi:MAG: TonB-dependent receptor [Brevundimonas sp. 12-68-7]|uniref:TonB-dependent receptor n=1 Tax=Brevundimonas subvibrioides TaxID=74313 RepID=A0A258FK44_9CAUL|nr:MAG: TonB-dependent receptor [Brevundimonas sp. 12-68-7]OYX32344.1 MAG: TonB-dependent receptor [Brevundimonas subvibrioides]
MPRTVSVSALALLASLATTHAQAQTAPAPVPTQDQQATALDEIVVTGVAGSSTTLRSSVSVTTLNTEAVEDLAVRSTAEIFRTIPGIRSESSGGEGNANIAVRGIPISTGGAKFLQIQEDGLPVLEFGDIAFGNADIFTRYDATIARVQAVRGGSASTLASNSPGGIINLITETGRAQGGSLALTRGLDFDTTRGDFQVGGPIGEGLYGSIGGFYRTGEGARDAGYTAEEGGQIRASITREFETGYVRLTGKYLNDKAIGYLPSPIRVTGTNGDPDWGPLPGYDASDQTLHSALFRRAVGLDGSNGPRVSELEDGMNPEVLQGGLEARFDLGSGWALENRFRIADASGGFVSPFTAGVASGAATATQIGGAGATARYANGPNAGQSFPADANGNGLVAQVVLFDVDINDFGNMANDLRLTRDFDVGGGILSATFGYYRASQSIDMDWLWNAYLLEVRGDNAALIDVFNAGGVPQTQLGQVAFGASFFGNCCRRSYDVDYDIDAPYAALNWEAGNLILDASLRYDSGSASGSYADGIVTTRDISGDGVIQAPERQVSVIDFANIRPVDYEWDYVSWSIGANYRINDDVAVFGRASRGGRANADRLLFSPSITPSGDILDDDAAVDMVEQYELGVRYRGPVQLFATAFFATTEETNFEATSQTFTDAEYEARGIEIEAFWNHGDFDFTGGLTWTDAEIVRDALNPANVGNTPRRQADWVYQATGAYSFGPLRIGANLIGTTDSFAGFNNGLVLPGYVIVNPFVSYDLTDDLSVALNVNNVFDEFAVTESEEGSIIDNATNVVRARTLNGRTATVALRYRF